MNGDIITSIQIIPFDDIIKATSAYSEEKFSNFSEYLTKVSNSLTSLDETDLSTTLWYSTEDAEIELATIIEYAVRHKYSRIILEHLTDIL